jgi:Transposase DDE domain
MLSISEQLILVYCLADDGLKNEKNKGQWRKSNNQPKCTDAEIISVAMMQSYFGCATLKRTYLLVKANEPKAFPHLPSYKQWLNRWHQLSFQMGIILESIPINIRDLEEIYVIDSFPIPMCQPIRHGRVNLLRDEGASFGKGTKGWFFGFKLHVLSTRSGQIVGSVLLPTSYDDREGARRLASLMEEGSLAIADLGYRGKKFQLEMYEEEGVLFLTRADIKDRKMKIIHSMIRERVEGVFSSLWERFATRVYSRSWNGLWNTLKLKMLDYKLCFANIISYA